MIKILMKQRSVRVTISFLTSASTSNYIILTVPHSFAHPKIRASGIWFTETIRMLAATLTLTLSNYIILTVPHSFAHPKIRASGIWFTETIRMLAATLSLDFSILHYLLLDTAVIFTVILRRLSISSRWRVWLRRTCPNWLVGVSGDHFVHAQLLAKCSNARQKDENHNSLLEKVNTKTESPNDFKSVLFVTKININAFFPFSHCLF